MNTIRPARLTLVEIVLFALIAPVFLMFAGSGALRAPDQSLPASLFWDFVAGLIYFGPAIIGAALLSALVAMTSKRMPTPWRTIFVVGAPAVLLPIAVAVSLAIEARRGAPLINRGSPYVYIAAPAGLLIGLVMALVLRTSEEKVPLEPTSRTPATF